MFRGQCTVFCLFEKCFFLGKNCFEKSLNFLTTVSQAGKYSWPRGMRKFQEGHETGSFSGVESSQGDPGASNNLPFFCSCPWGDRMEAAGWLYLLCVSLWRSPGSGLEWVMLHTDSVAVDRKTEEASVCTTCTAPLLFYAFFCKRGNNLHCSWCWCTFSGTWYKSGGPEHGGTDGIQMNALLPH